MEENKSKIDFDKSNSMKEVTPNNENETDKQEEVTLGGSNLQNS